MSYKPSPAGFWKRYVAYFIDIAILYVIVEILSSLFFAFRGQSELGSLKEILATLQAAQASGETPDLLAIMQTLQAVILPALIFSTVAYLVLAGIYFSVMESSPQQATLGKRLLGIKVTGIHGQRIGLPQSIARFFAASLSWITMNLGHALAAWTPERRAMHDYLAATRVENVDPQNPGMPLWGWAIIFLHALAFIGACLLMVLMMWLMMQQISAI